MQGVSGPRRWHEQRWLIDSILRTDGLEWDQPRVAYTLRPMGIDAVGDFERAKSRVTKFADLTPVFLELADHLGDVSFGGQGWARSANRQLDRLRRGLTEGETPCQLWMELA